MNIDYSKLHQKEIEFLQRTKGTYWDSEYEEKRLQDRIKREAKEKKKKKVGFEIYKDEDVCYIPEYEIFLEHYMDIALLFAGSERFSSFVNYMFSTSLTNKQRGGSPFFYHAQTNSYCFDYVYVLISLHDWAVSRLGANKHSMFHYLSQFAVGSSRGYYLKANYFLISSIFGRIYNMSQDRYQKIYYRKNGKIAVDYYAPTIVRAGDGKEYFFYNVQFSAITLLRYLDRSLAIELLQRRDSLDLEQVAFGTAAKLRSKGDAFPFATIAFPS